IFATILPALANDPELRPQSGAELARFVEAAANPLAQRARSRRRGRWLWAGIAVGIAAASVLLGQRLWTKADASTARGGRAAQGPGIEVGGTPSDWGKDAKVIGTFDDAVYCFSLLPGGEAARIVLGTPRRVVELDLASGRRTTSSLPSEVYQFGCPELS